MSRIVVVGGHGFFGAAVVRTLRRRGHDPAVPARAELDVEDPASIRAALRPDDVVIDAAGPFQRRSTVLVEVAAGVGADVIDLSDSLDYALRVQSMRERIETAEIHVLTACSAVSVATAALLARSGIAEPERVSVCLVPASAETATSGTAGSLAMSIGRHVRFLANGRPAAARGWSRARAFWSPPGFGPIRGHLAESADAVTLPQAWPSLRGVDFWVDTHVPAVNALLRAVTVVRGARRLARPLIPAGVRFARRFGTAGGGFVVEVAGGAELTALGLFASRNSFMVAVLPAVLAAEGFLAADMGPPGVIPPNQQVDAERYLSELDALGIGLAAR